MKLHGGWGSYSVIEGVAHYCPVVLGVGSYSVIEGVVRHEYLYVKYFIYKFGFVCILEINKIEIIFFIV